MIGTLEQAVTKLLNIAAQKLLKIAKESMRKQESGYDPEQEFCDLTKIQAVIFRLQKGGDISIKEVECVEQILIGIGGYGNKSTRGDVIAFSTSDIKFKEKVSTIQNTLNIIDNMIIRNYASK